MCTLPGTEQEASRTVTGANIHSSSNTKVIVVGSGGLTFLAMFGADDNREDQEIIRGVES